MYLILDFKILGRPSTAWKLLTGGGVKSSNLNASVSATSSIKFLQIYLDLLLRSWQKMLNRLRDKIWGYVFGRLPSKQQEQVEMSGDHLRPVTVLWHSLAHAGAVESALDHCQAGREGRGAVKKLHTSSSVVLCGWFLGGESWGFFYQFP